MSENLLSSKPLLKVASSSHVCIIDKNLDKIKTSRTTPARSLRLSLRWRSLKVRTVKFACTWFENVMKVKVIMKVESVSENLNESESGDEN